MDLYAIRIEQKEADKAVLKVFQVYVDGEDRAPQPEPHFFLTVIAEQVGPMNKRLESLPPLAQEILRLKPSRSASEHDALDHFLGKHFDRHPQGYLLSVEEMEVNEGEEGRDGIFHWSYDEETGQFHDPEHRMTWGLYAVTMTDARWLAHLEVGKLFGTAAYFA